MALSEYHKNLLAELADETYETVDGLLADLDPTPGQEQHLLELLNQYGAVRFQLSFRMSGGKDGIELNDSDARNELSRRARRALGLSAAGDEMPTFFTTAPGGRGK